MRRKSWITAAMCAVLGIAAAAAAVTAKEPPRPAANGEPGHERTVSGRVDRLLRNPHDDVDGFLLDSGDEVHFPPHLGEDVLALIRVGDRVAVTGTREPRPRGEEVFEASRIVQGKDAIDIERPRPPRGPRGPRRGEESMQASGKIVAYSENPRGDVDGLVLADGTEIKLPPHQSAELQSFARKGDLVEVDGRKHVTRGGAVHLHADRIENENSGKVLMRDEPEGPPAPPRPPRNDDDRARNRPTAETPPTGASNEEILTELRALRRLLEELRK